MDSAGTIVYIPGASDRRTGDPAKGVDHHEALIRERLRRLDKGYRVVSCEWARKRDAEGHIVDWPTLDHIGLAIPEEGTLSVEPTAVTEPLPPREPPMARLERLGRPRDGAKGAAPAPAGSLEADLVLAVAQRVPGPSLAIDARRFGVTAEQVSAAVGSAAAEVASSEAYRAARVEPSEASLVEEVIGTVAAMAADRLPLHSDEARTWLEHGVVDLLRASLVGFFGGATFDTATGILLAGFLGADLGDSVKVWATDMVRPRRREIMKNILGLADILVYQRAGDTMRRAVKDSLQLAREEGGRVIALGNSLGGIILVDAAREMRRDGRQDALPDLLVTAGSQSSVLHTFGALGWEEDARPFTPWLNIYDLRDFLAFVAQPVWPGVDGISDVRVDLGKGFPDAHGQSYLASDEVFRIIFDHLPPRERPR